ncbi:toxin VasX [Halomonas elongata]|uniref:toxin VasX n=1 Tax=Halomonas elongata TaxID=2746 RepID=UPI0023AF3099|nr:toxin VasX [Halomonas elongata]
MSIDMEAANRVADNQSDNDPGQEAGQCPLQKPDLQLVPVRYALVELEQEVSLPEVSPPIQGDFRPNGIRPVRQGWLYLIHNIAPDELQTFEVMPDGSGDPIILERRGSIKVLYSQVELEETRAALLLAKPEVQDEVMLTVNIGGYCPGNGTDHLLPPDKLGEVLADDLGDRTVSEERLDYGQYQWTASADWQTAQAVTIKGNIQAEYREDSACLIVEDVVARANDLVGAWTLIAGQEADWLDEEPEKHFAARAIDGFMQLDLQPMIARAGQGEIPGWLSEASESDREQLRELMELQNRYDEKHSEDLASSGGHPGFRSREQQALEAEVNSVSAELAERLGTDAESVRDFARETRDDYFERVYGSQEGDRWLAQQGIEDVIRLGEMREFLAEADQWQGEWRAHKEQVGEDIKTLLPRWHEYASLLDGEDDTQAILRSSLEHRLFTTLEACGQQDFLIQHYFGEVTVAHRLHVTPLTGFINAAAANWKNAQASLMALMSAKDTPGTHAQWRERVDQQDQLRLQNLDGLGEEARATVVTELTAKERVMGRSLLAGVLDETESLNLEERFTALFDRTSNGIRHQLYTRLSAYQLGWEIPEQSVLDRLNGLIQRAERLADEVESTSRIERALERQRQQLPKRDYDTRIRQARAAVRQQRQALADVLDELAEATYPLDEAGNQAFKVTGLSEQASRAALNERRLVRQALQDQNAWDALLRNEQGDIAPRRAIPVGVSGFMLLLNGYLFSGAIQQLVTAARTGNRRFEAIMSVASGATGTIAATASVLEILHNTRYRRLYEGRSFQSAVQQAAGSLDHLDDWARLTNRAMIGVAGFSFFAAAFDVVRQGFKLGRASTDRERLAAGIALAGDLAIIGGTLPIAIAGLAGKIRGTSATILRLRLLRLAVPLNWVAFVGVVLVVIGELLYEYYSLSPLQQWCQKSVWGDESEGWDLQAHHQHLAEVHGKPVLWRRGEQPPRISAMPVGPEPPAKSLNLRLNLPGVEVPNADNLQVGFWGVTRGSQQELHEDMMAHAGITQEEGNCRLDYALDPERVGDWHTLVLVVRITSQGASSPTATSAFEVFSRLDAVSPREEWRPVESLEGRKASTWQAMPLVPWTA